MVLSTYIPIEVYFQNTSIACRSNFNLFDRNVVGVAMMYQGEQRPSGIQLVPWKQMATHPSRPSQFDVHSWESCQLDFLLIWCCIKIKLSWRNTWAMTFNFRIFNDLLHIWHIAAISLTRMFYPTKYNLACTLSMLHEEIIHKIV